MYTFWIKVLPSKIMLPQKIIVVFNIFYLNRLVFSVLLQNISESVTFVTLWSILDKSILTLLSQWYSWCSWVSIASTFILVQGCKPNFKLKFQGFQGFLRVFFWIVQGLCHENPRVFQGIRHKIKGFPRFRKKNTHLSAEKNTESLFKNPKMLCFFFFNLCTNPPNKLINKKTIL